MTAQLIVDAIGPASSVQDGGRWGAQRYGLTTSGAMDALGLAQANALLGNALDAAAIEIGPFGATLRADGGDLAIALAGAERTAAIGDRALRWPQSCPLRRGETLTLGFARRGAFSYLALAGGVAGDPVFGSRSVTNRAGLGSPYPRALQAGDRLAATATRDCEALTFDRATVADGPIRVVLGPQDDEFDDAAISAFLNAEWTVSATSDRMGYRLEGPAVPHRHGHNIVSDGTARGSIQVPGAGSPIVLMADRGTSGGYPKIATVVTADFGRLAQSAAGSKIRFAALAVADAQSVTRAFLAELRALPGRAQPVRDGALDLAALGYANVAGTAVSASDATSWQSGA